MTLRNLYLVLPIVHMTLRNLYLVFPIVPMSHPELP